MALDNTDPYWLGAGVVWAVATDAQFQALSTVYHVNDYINAGGQRSNGANTRFQARTATGGLYTVWDFNDSVAQFALVDTAPHPGIGIWVVASAPLAGGVPEPATYGCVACAAIVGFIVIRSNRKRRTVRGQSENISC